MNWLEKGKKLDAEFDTVQGEMMALLKQPLDKRDAGWAERRKSLYERGNELLAARKAHNNSPELEAMLAEGIGGA